MDKNKIKKLIADFKKLTWPDRDLTRELLTELRIHDVVELEFTLNSKFKRERDAAMNMLEKYLDDLMSEDPKRFHEAKDTLMQIYYAVDSPDEEALL